MDGDRQTPSPAHETFRGGANTWEGLSRGREIEATALLVTYHRRERGENPRSLALVAHSCVTSSLIAAALVSFPPILTELKSADDTDVTREESSGRSRRGKIEAIASDSLMRQRAAIAVRMRDGCQPHIPDAVARSEVSERLSPQL